jgi:glycosyltransferase involved in cell wall biosynthesis
MRISVVTPNFNMAPYLEDTIKSVIGNLRPDDEYFVIDGGSTDGSVDIIRRHQCSLTGWVSEKDAGYADALAKGFARATGDILCWVNSSDLLLPKALECVRHLFESRPEDLIYGDVFNVDESNNVLWKSSANFPPLKYHMLYGGGTPWQVGCFWRRGIYQAIGGIRPDLRFAADYDFFLRLCLIGSALYVPKIFGAHRHHPGQLSIAGSSSYEDERSAVQAVAMEGEKNLLATRLLMRSIFSFTARAHARIALILSRRDPLRGTPLSVYRCE